MKKIFAFVILFTVLAVSSTKTLAVTVPAVGSRGEKGGVEDGVGNFTPVGSGGQIKVRVQEVINMYAVDITYEVKTVKLPGLIWDVNQLKYVFEEEKIQGDINYSVTVTNYSDLSVNASLTAADSDSDDGVSVKFDKSSATVPAVITDGSAENGVDEPFVITVSSKNWADSVSYYTVGGGKPEAGQPAARDVKVAEITVKISK